MFTASLATETNTFAPAPTGIHAFSVVLPGDEAGSGEVGPTLIDRLRSWCERDGHTLVASLSAEAQPSGRTHRSAFEQLRDRILDDLRAAMPVDAVMLFLHGAMVAEGYDDCEGDLLARVRALVGPGVAVGAELDLHCHVSEQMCSAADVLVCYKEYPHVDAEARARELYAVLLDTAAGRVRPRTAVFDCRMVGLYPTVREPMASFVARMQSFEGRDGVLSVSLGHGFPYGDVADCGARLWVVTDANVDVDGSRGRSLATSLGREFWQMREQVCATALPVDDAIDAAVATVGGPVVLADLADNPGGGAPGDSTFILRRVLERKLHGVVSGAYWDLGAVQVCREAGEGATLDLRVGGKVGIASGDPVDLRVKVRAIRDEHFQTGLGFRLAMGPSVWVEAANDVHLLLCSVRCQVYGTDLFTGIGIDLSAARIVVVKSTQHFEAEFGPIARRVIHVDTPGAVTLAFDRIPYRVRDLRYWPRDQDPHRSETAA